jgi:hypothetical protein
MSNRASSFGKCVDLFLRGTRLTLRQFLDAQRIHNLTSFLEALHAKGLANPAHTSLLLNCFTKLKDTARLDAFIKSSALNSTDGSPPFDLDTALRVTRQAGYYDHAVYLAKRYGQAEEYLKIQVEDREDWPEAAQYIRGMGAKAVSAPSAVVLFCSRVRRPRPNS